MAAGEPPRQDPGALKEQATQSRGAVCPYRRGGLIVSRYAAWTRSWQLLGSTLWSCWVVTELFSRLLQEAKVEQGERERSPSPHVRLRAPYLCTSHRREPQVEVDMLSTFDGLPLQHRDQPLCQVSVCGCLA